MADVPKVNTVPKVIKVLAESNSDIPAFIFWSQTGRRVLTRGDVLDLSSRFAYRLKERGVSPGDVVCVTLPNSPERIVVEFGIQLAGAVCMNGQILRADGIDFMETLNKGGCRILVVNPNTNNGAWDICRTFAKDHSSEKNWVTVNDSRIQTVAVMILCKPGTDSDCFIPSLKDEMKYLHTGTDPSDIASIYTTSGSSGYTKLVKYDHKSLINMGRSMTSDYGSTEIHKIFNASPFGWLGGFSGNPLFSGRTRVLLDESEEIPNKAAFTWNTICAEDVPDVLLFPSLYMDIYHQYKAAKVTRKTVQMIMTGGQPIKKEQLCSILETLTHTVRIGYGATEIGAMSSLLVDAKTVEDFTDCSVGHVIHGLNMKIVDELMNIVPTETRGEIAVRSPSQSKGYVGDPDANSNFLPDGWFRTGDVGYFKPDGSLVVEGRSSDAIMHGAYILYPAWLEKQLVSCPGVRQLAIVPVPDEALHHEICACVMLEDGVDKTEDDIITFAKQQFKLKEGSALAVVPRYVLFFDSFPCTKTNKLHRRELAHAARRRLNL